jgi:hypothetical protein
MRSQEIASSSIVYLYANALQAFLCGKVKLLALVIRENPEARGKWVTWVGEYH